MRLDCAVNTRIVRLSSLLPRLLCMLRSKALLKGQTKSCSSQQRARTCMHLAQIRLQSHRAPFRCYARALACTTMQRTACFKETHKGRSRMCNAILIGRRQPADLCHGWVDYGSEYLPSRATRTKAAPLPEHKACHVMNGSLTHLTSVNTDQKSARGLNGPSSHGRQYAAACHSLHKLTERAWSTDCVSEA